MENGLECTLKPLIISYICSLIYTHARDNRLSLAHPNYQNLP